MRSLFLSSLAAGVALTSVAANPFVERYPADVLFYAGWDRETMRPDIGYATWSKKQTAFSDKGVLGGCYAGGSYMFSYDPKDRESRLIDTTKPGSFAVWVKYSEERQVLKRTNGRWEPGFGILEFTDGAGQALHLMKSSDCRWGDGTIKVHHQGRDAAGKTTSGGACGAKSSFVDWKPDMWRFVVVSWTVDSLRISVDGEPFRQTPMKGTLSDFSRGHLFLKADARTMLDELVVLGRPLSNEEVKSLHEAFQRQRETAKTGD